jgi:hypothetical protein
MLFGLHEIAQSPAERLKDEDVLQIINYVEGPFLAAFQMDKGERLVPVFKNKDIIFPALETLSATFKDIMKGTTLAIATEYKLSGPIRDFVMGLARLLLENQLHAKEIMDSILTTYLMLCYSFLTTKAPIAPIFGVSNQALQYNLVQKTDRVHNVFDYFDSVTFPSETFLSTIGPSMKRVISSLAFNIQSSTIVKYDANCKYVDNVGLVATKDIYHMEKLALDVKLQQDSYKNLKRSYHVPKAQAKLKVFQDSRDFKPISDLSQLDAVLETFQDCI